ncbi:protein fixA; electron transfer flavoprotein beta-subunit (Beta-ETF) [Candidatus Methylomirabilis lanthanidiphila]|uniref:Protein fixA electron transfer flavoprotein beta-subunit (Beta-ETF) n=1 Tax=Candidatus Methylomirabilis lanthanidiphila TaxID=2211376 RepID=A0A564ZIY4_9BACT|nr:electron transfer flavoprotein subunit beta/FixA family protein [Candidatus Methylomirabilis lanthanidiphila]VUZ85275.1 protein fixA; electron transfer flavoprotein beta-subunit (Beta-ETF) [Candidatus Methylomirabilis lanthanidiphila]
MNIIVCIKQIIDPETPMSQFMIDSRTKRQVQGNNPLVISPYDANALEVAIQLKEKQGAKVTAISIGGTTAMTALKSALSMGADEAILVNEPLLVGSDQQGIAHALAKTIRKAGAYDLILTGCESGDWADRAVPAFLAEELEIGYVGYVTRIEVRDGQVVVRRVVEDGYELIEAKPPLLAAISSDETNTARYAKLRDIMAAAKKTIPVWKAADLGLDPERIGPGAVRVAITDVSIPVKESRCEMIEGNTPEEKAATLAARLRELKLI